MENEDFINGSGQKLYRRAKKLIPGGTQLRSKGLRFRLLIFGMHATQKQKVPSYGTLQVENILICQ